MQILLASSSSPNTVSELEGTSEILSLTHFREGELDRAQSEAVTDTALVKLCHRGLGAKANFITFTDHGHGFHYNN